MRPKVLEIAWHETQAVYSADFQALPPTHLKRLLAVSSTDDADEKTSQHTTGRQYRMASAGGDSKVRIWMVYPNIPSISSSTYTALTGQDYTQHPPRVEYLATLSKHTAPVNVVRFSPNGQMLASAGDDGNVILWVQSDRPNVPFGESSEDQPDKEHWRLQKMLQVTTKHVYDLAWSPDGEFLIAGSTDNTATIWKAATGECVYALREHSHNVQGVSWDPLNEYIATQSSDRSVHVNSFTFRGNVAEVHPVSRATRLDIRHSRTPSTSSVRPSMARRGSTTSEAGSAITTASDFPEASFPLQSALAAVVTATPATPSASNPSTPQPLVPAPMNPPLSNRPSSRRSSFSGSQAAASPALSAATFNNLARATRSPSPIPPLPAIRAAPAMTVNQRLYGEESATRFFRRLTFSPDGSLLLTPAGQIEDQVFRNSPLLTTRSLPQDPELSSSSSIPRSRHSTANHDNSRPTAYIYSRANLARAPIAHLPGHKTSSVAIRFSPVFYDLRTASSSAGTSSGSNGGLGVGAGSTAVSGAQLHAEPRHVMLDKNDKQPVHVSLMMPPPPAPPAPPSSSSTSTSKEIPKEGGKGGEKEEKMGSVFALPYRLLYAVACQDSVLLYDTQQAGPIAIFKGLHYAGFTDLAWSPDGQCLLLTSADGYCSIIIFDLGELGTVHPTQQHHRQLQAIAQSHSGAIVGAGSHSHRESIGSAYSNHGTSGAAGSPAVGVARQSPTPSVLRSDREGSTASSLAGGVGGPFVNITGSISARPPPSVASSTTSTTEQHVLPTPTPSEKEGPVGLGISRGTVSGGIGEEGKKREGENEAAEGTKKKRRVALTHLEEEP
nr:chromatin assembly factor 1 subunit B [Cryptococcus depauperatus CBS 7855]